MDIRITLSTTPHSSSTVSTVAAFLLLRPVAALSSTTGGPHSATGIMRQQSAQPGSPFRDGTRTRTYLPCGQKRAAVLHIVLYCTRGENVISTRDCTDTSFVIVSYSTGIGRSRRIVLRVPIPITHACQLLAIYPSKEVIRCALTTGAGALLRNHIEETALPIERQFITDLYRINH